MIILNLVLVGLAITLEPIPLTAFILVLASKGGEGGEVSECCKSGQGNVRRPAGDIVGEQGLQIN